MNDNPYNVLDSDLLQSLDEANRKLKLARQLVQDVVYILENPKPNYKVASALAFSKKALDILDGKE